MYTMQTYILLSGPPVCMVRSSFLFAMIGAGECSQAQNINFRIACCLRILCLSLFFWLGRVVGLRALELHRVGEGGP